MRSRLLAAALLVLALPQLVLAQPAVIRVFEAQARSAPAADAPVLHVFPEDAQVSVSETAEHGWRKVRLPDGAVAWVEEAALSFDVPAAPAAPEAPNPRAVAALGAATSAPEVTNAAKIYVKDLDHLAALTRSDPVVFPQAERLASRRKGAIAVGLGGLAVSVALMAVGASRMDDEFDRAFDSPELGRQPGNDGQTMLLSGMGLVFVTGLVTWAIHPKRGDFLDVINGWNERHPDETFEVEFFGTGHHGHHALP